MRGQDLKVFFLSIACDAYLLNKIEIGYLTLVSIVNRFYWSSPSWKLFKDVLRLYHFKLVYPTKLVVPECYELSAEYEGKHNPKKLDELGNVIASLDPGDSIVVAKAFS